MVGWLDQDDDKAISVLDEEKVEVLSFQMNAWAAGSVLNLANLSPN